MRGIIAARDRSARERRPRRPHDRSVGVLATVSTLCVLVLGACGGGGGRGGGGGGGFTPLAEGSTAALLEVAAPVYDEFVLRGTIPVQPGTYPRGDGQSPFAVRDWDGALLIAQTEIVSYYPNDDVDGADVVEVVARVSRDPATPPGTLLQYEVVLSPHAPVVDPGTPDVSDLTNGPVGVPAGVQSFLAGGSNITISALDCFGNSYVFYPLQANGNEKLTRHGEATAELRTYGSMIPAPSVPGPTGTLPHLLGVHAYVSTYSGEDYVGLDLRFHNGHSGNDPTSDQDDPLDKVYFQQIDVLVPTGWVVQQDFEDPSFGTPTTIGLFDAYPIVKPEPGGKMHVLRWQGQFHRRLAISPASSSGEARNFLNQAGRGFAKRGTDPVEGHPYWSWWNPYTARYFPQSFQLPSLEHMGLGLVRIDLSNEFDDIKDHLVNGTSDGGYPVQSGAMGWGHPFGVPYGGMTGGAEIHMVQGVRTAEAASVKGLRMHQAVHRMHTDRQPMALYDLDGEPTCVDDWLIDLGGANDYVPFFHFMVPQLMAGDPFGFDQAPQFQIDHVTTSGLQPTWESTHFSYDPHDYQHFIRYTRSAKALVWLSNDSLAKDDLRMQAENFNLSYHPYYNSAFQVPQVSGLRWDQDYVAVTFASGFPYGRGEAWGLDCAVAAYRTADPAWRAARRPWLDQIALLLSDGQAACSGFIQANIASKFVGGKYRARQQIEQSITENAVRGLLESVYRGDDPAMAALMQNVLVKSLNASISNMAWYPGETGPWTYTAVGPLDLGQPVWCSYTQIPGDGYTPAYDTFQNWASFAYGYDLTLNPQFLSMALLQLGGSDLLTELELDGDENLWNRAGLIALSQRLNGDI